MESLFKPAKAFFKAEQITIDNAVFKMHYRITMMLLVTASAFLTSKMFFTSSILCSHGQGLDHFASKIEDQYCFTHSTFSIFGSTTIVHSEYKWVSVVLFLQAVTFYIPRYIWKTVENNRTTLLIQNLNHPLQSQDEANIQISHIARYWQRYSGTHYHLALTYLFCETLNLINVISQIAITNFFLGGQFLTIGTNLLQEPFSESIKAPQYDSIDHIFPTTTKCTLPSYDTTGMLTKRDIICLLPHNEVHKYVYVMLWFWYCFLASITAFNTFFKISTFILPATQISIISKMSRSSKSKVLTLLQLKDKTYFLQIGDSFMIKLILKNIKNQRVSHDFIDSLVVQDNSKDV